MRKTSVTTVNMEFDEYIAHQHVFTWFVRRIRISKNGNISFTNCSECSLTFAAFVPIACTHSSNDTYFMFILILIPAICSGTALIAYFWLCVESHANMKFHTQQLNDGKIMIMYVIAKWKNFAYILHRFAHTITNPRSLNTFTQANIF